MSKPIRFGVVSSGAASHDDWITLARRAEELGYSSLLIPDRLGTPLAAFTALAVAAEATTRLRVGCHVFANDYRHPVILAREAATLDLLSQGRFELGIGAGVGQPDYNQMGIPLESAGIRISRVAETLQILKQFFSEETVNFTGQYYTVTNLWGMPRTVQQPHPPIFIGSTGKRMLSLAAREADTISPEMRMVAPGNTQGADQPDATLAEKVAWIRDAAGARFEQLELCQTFYGLTITDSSTPVTPSRWSAFQPLALTTAQAVAHVREQYEQLGFSYFRVFEGQMENFAPVLAQFASR